MYEVPIAQPTSVIGGNGVCILRSPLVAIPYNVGAEFPADPLRLWQAWVSGYWVITSTYNGK